MQNARISAWKPDARLRELLRAVILEDDRWKDAWIGWRRSADLENLPPGAFRLLPRLYRKLRAENVTDPWMGRLQGIYRHTWARNQTLLRETTQAAQVLHKAGIPVMLIKGAALILSIYRDAGLCPTVDMDLLVPDSQANAAFGCLRADGFSATGRYQGGIADRFLRIGFSHPVRSPQGYEIDVHWHLLYFRSFAGADETFWGHAVRAELSGLPVLLPAATDMLLNTCLHGMCWSSTSSLRWAMDAAALIRGADIDWDRLAAYASWPGVPLPLRLSLEYLRDELELPVPEIALRKIRAAPVSDSDRWVFMTYAGQEGLLWNTLSLWFRHTRFSRTEPASLLRLIAELPQFLAAYWALPSSWSVPGLALQKVARRISRGTLNGEVPRDG
jgi:hypothetical protein